MVGYMEGPSQGFQCLWSASQDRQEHLGLWGLSSRRTYSICDDIVEEQGGRGAHCYDSRSSIAGIAHAAGAGWERFPEHGWGEWLCQFPGRWWLVYEEISASGKYLNARSDVFEAITFMQHTS